MYNEEISLIDQDYEKNLEIDLIKGQVFFQMKIVFDIFKLFFIYIYIYIQLDELNTELKDKSTMFFTLQINFENAVKELNRIKVEMSDTISQKQQLKEANARLTLQLEAVIEDSNVINN